MKQLLIMISIIGCLGYSVGGLAASSPMVEKHIFLPEKQSEAAVSSDELREKLVFSGVLISQKGRYAFIREKTRQKGPDTQRIYQEGDVISGALITSIQPNHLILVNDDGEIRLKLYAGNKKRPAPVTVQAPPDIQSGANTDTAQAGGEDVSKSDGQSTGGEGAASHSTKSTSRTGNKSTQDQQSSKKENSATSGGKSNPFADALKKALEKNQGSSSGTANPFLEAIKRAQQKQ